MTPAVVIRPIWSQLLGEPEVAVRAGRDAVRELSAVGIGNSVMTPAGGDPPDLVAHCRFR